MDDRATTERSAFTRRADGRAVTRHLFLHDLIAIVVAIAFVAVLYFGVRALSEATYDLTSDDDASAALVVSGVL